MRIVPEYDMLIEGNHCQKGIPVEVSSRTGIDLVNQRIAKVAPAIKPDPAPETATAKHQTKETAAKRK